MLMDGSRRGANAWSRAVVDTLLEPHGGVHSLHDAVAGAHGGSLRVRPRR